MILRPAMALLTPMSLSEATVLAGRFGVRIVHAEPLSAGSVNSNFRFRGDDGALYFARIYEEQGFEGARTEIDLLTALHGEGVPVVRPLLTRDGAGTTEFAGKPFVLFPWVEGEWLCLRRVTPERCRTLGAALARVHLASPRVGSLPQGRFRPPDMLERLTKVEASGVRELDPFVARIREAYARYLEQRRELPSGVCHGDLFRDNVLWSGERLAALLDFESASWGCFAYDLMVTALAWCYTDSLQLDRVRALFEGYASVRIPSAAERESLEVEGALACLRFATTRITDFELRTPPGARPARDFRRFLERLAALESNILDSVREQLAGRTQGRT
ncbi:MAG TPA: homoserine kinase [Polyangiaceae bacterium]